MTKHKNSFALALVIFTNSKVLIAAQWLTFSLSGISQFCCKINIVQYCFLAMETTIVCNQPSHIRYNFRVYNTQKLSKPSLFPLYNQDLYNPIVFITNTTKFRVSMSLHHNSTANAARLAFTSKEHISKIILEGILHRWISLLELHRVYTVNGAKISIKIFPPFIESTSYTLTLDPVLDFVEIMEDSLGLSPPV